MPKSAITSLPASPNPTPPGSGSSVRSQLSTQTGGQTTLFGHMLDAVNPMHHVPVVNRSYQRATGDTISDGATLAGHVGFGAVIAGPVGAAVGAGVFLLEKAFGWLTGGGSKTNKTVVEVGPSRSEPAPSRLVPMAQPRGTSPLLAPSGASPVVMMPAGQQGSGSPPQTSAAGRAASVQTGERAPVDMSNAQFAALLAAFGSGADDAQQQGAAALKAERQAQEPDARTPPADFANRMQANLARMGNLDAAAP